MNVYAALYEYSLDIEIIAGYASLPDPEKVGGVEFQVNTADFSYLLGDAIPSAGNWIYEGFGTGPVFGAVYDNYSDFTNLTDIAPIVSSGNVVTLMSDVQLSITNVAFYDYNGNYPTLGDTFTSQGFVETIVPIPSAIFLLGGGLVGLVALRRRKS
jgi:hypothetical protein